MRNIIVFNNVTIDGFMAGPKGELDWAIHDDEITQFSKTGQDSIDTFMFGRVTYDMMASFWPTPAGKAMNPVYANVLNNAQKIVFSRTLEKADWEHTQIVKDISKEGILALKNQPGKDFMIFGSGTIIEQLTEMNLIDEYQFILTPIVLGKGKPLFHNITNRKQLRLKNSKTFQSGAVLLVYNITQ